MSLQRCLKGILAGALALGIAGCSSTASKPAEPVSVLCPTGAPALATLGLSDTNNVEYVDGQELLLAELSKSDGDYDLIVAPINLGVKAFSQAQAYQLAGVVSWGNLYVVAEDANWNTPETRLALFGEGAVPGLVFNDLYENVEAQTTWYASVSEASQALLSGQADAALLAQPAAAAALNKAQEAGRELAIQADLQSEWQNKYQTQTKGYPQAALFVKKGAENTEVAISEMSAFLENPDAEKIETRIDEIGVERLGVPSAKLIASIWDSLNLHYVQADQAQSEIEQFLALFGISMPEGILADSQNQQ